MRIVFIGAVEFSQRVLECLIGTKANIVGVCTLEKSSFNADHYDLGKTCSMHGIQYIYTPNINSDDSFQWIVDKKPDVIFCFGWSKLIQYRLLKLPPLGIIGYHPTALPSNRGRHPIIWALVLGLQETASTFFIMGEEADCGDILSQRKIKIEEHDDATSLYEKITRCALGQITNIIPQLAADSVHREIQDDQITNIWRKRTKEDGEIDWRMSAYNIHNLVRGLTKPYTGAHFVYKGEEIKVWKSRIIKNVPQNIEPGKILSMEMEGVIVKCGDNGILLVKTEPEFNPLHGGYL